MVDRQTVLYSGLVWALCIHTYFGNSPLIVVSQKPPKKPRPAFYANQKPCSAHRLTSNFIYTELYALASYPKTSENKNMWSSNLLTRLEMQCDAFNWTRLSRQSGLQGPATLCRCAGALASCSPDSWVLLGSRLSWRSWGPPRKHHH